jgi:hypothetical protein
MPQPQISIVQTAYSLAAVAHGIKRVLPDTSCSPSPAPLDGLSHLVFRAAEPAMEGVVVGAPDGGLPSVSATPAHALSDRTGAGLVTAHGFEPPG